MDERFGETRRASRCGSRRRESNANVVVFCVHSMNATRVVIQKRFIGSVAGLAFDLNQHSPHRYEQTCRRKCKPGLQKYSLLPVWQKGPYTFSRSFRS
jgi:hypothetical protein